MIKLKDIAEKTGFSIPTVSKALKNSPEISEETSAVVKRMAEDLGYQSRNSKKRKKIIGVVVPEVCSQYYATLLTSISQSLENEGYISMTMITNFNGQKDKAVIKQLCKYKPDGIIISCYHKMSKDIYDVIRSSQIPVLFLEEIQQTWTSDEDVDSIFINQKRCVQLLLDHLCSLGHSRIGYLGEKNSNLRYSAMAEYIKDNGLSINDNNVIIGSERFEKGGYFYGQQLLEKGDIPTAVFCSYDQIAYGAMKAFWEHGLRIPEDISIVGFDNNVMDEYSHVSLTTVTNPAEEMGVVAVKILLDKINNPDTHVVQRVSLQGRLIIRNSTCPPRGIL